MLIDGILVIERKVILMNEKQVCEQSGSFNNLQSRISRTYLSEML